MHRRQLTGDELVDGLAGVRAVHDVLLSREVSSASGCFFAPMLLSLRGGLQGSLCESCVQVLLKVTQCSLDGKVCRGEDCQLPREVFKCDAVLLQFTRNEALHVSTLLKVCKVASLRCQQRFVRCFGCVALDALQGVDSILQDRRIASDVWQLCIADQSPLKRAWERECGRVARARLLELLQRRGGVLGFLACIEEAAHRGVIRLQRGRRSKKRGEQSVSRGGELCAGRSTLRWRSSGHSHRRCGDSWRLQWRSGCLR